MKVMMEIFGNKDFNMMTPLFRVTKDLPTQRIRPGDLIPHWEPCWSREIAVKVIKCLHTERGDVYLCGSPWIQQDGRLVHPWWA